MLKPFNMVETDRANDHDRRRITVVMREIELMR
jgi:hypothetical protein